MSRLDDATTGLDWDPAAYSAAQTWHAAVDAGRNWPQAWQAVVVSVAAPLQAEIDRLRELFDAASRSLARAHDGIVVMGPDETSMIASYVDNLTWLRSEVERLNAENSLLRAAACAGETDESARGRS